MSRADELLVEQRSRLSILVIEDNTLYGMNAMDALNTQRHNVKLVSTLEQAKHLIGKGQKFDVILSDVHVPVEGNDVPVPIVSEIMDICYRRGIPVCFVTKADHHGLLDNGEEGYVALKATTMGRVAQTLREVSMSSEQLSEKEMFRRLKAAGSKNIRSDDKTPEIWSMALEMARNASLQPTPVGKALRQVRSAVDCDFRAENGLLKITAPKK